MVLVKDKETKEPFDPELEVSRRMVELAKSPEYNMAIYSGVGKADGREHIIVAPPFIVTEQDIDHIVKVLSDVIEKVFTEINK